MSGTVEEMTANMRRFGTALILMIETTPADLRDTAEQKAAKRRQNLLTEQLMAAMRADGMTELLMMGAGRGRAPRACRPTAWTRRRWRTPST